MEALLLVRAVSNSTLGDPVEVLLPVRAFGGANLLSKPLSYVAARPAGLKGEEQDGCFEVLGEGARSLDESDV